MSDEQEQPTISFLQETQQRYDEIRASYNYHEAQCRRLMARMNEMIPAIWALEAEQKKQIRAVDDGEAMRKADTDASRQPISALTPQREDEVLLADQQDTPPQSNAQASETDAALYDWENSNLNGNNPNAITARTVAHLVVDSLGASSEASASARSDETVDPLPGEGQESRETCLQNAGLSDDGGLLNETLEASPPPSGLDSQAQPQASSEQSPLHDRPALTDTEYQGLQRFEDKPITTDEIREEIQSYYSDSEPEEIASLPTPVDDKEASEDPARMFSAGINREIDAKDRKPAFMGLFRKEPA